MDSANQSLPREFHPGRSFQQIAMLIVFGPVTLFAFCIANKDHPEYGGWRDPSFISIIVYLLILIIYQLLFILRTRLVLSVEELSFRDWLGKGTALRWEEIERIQLSHNIAFIGNFLHCYGRADGKRVKLLLYRFDNVVPERPRDMIIAQAGLDQKHFRSSIFGYAATWSRTPTLSNES
jgi:hypothetical protein